MDKDKPTLPYGWIMKQSKSYPDRVYYFNVNTGMSSWEFPDLIQPYMVASILASFLNISLIIFCHSNK